jgi:hypothetical protein
VPDVNIFVRAKDEASKVLRGIAGGVGGLGDVLLGVGTVGGVALAGLAIGAGKLAVDAARLEPVKITFDNLSKSIGSTADAMLKKLGPATMGMLSDADLMLAANKLMAMGLADTEDKAADLSKMAVTLGSAMGVDAASSLENFTLMLANQSIPRLDTFGISSGKVRQRIDELMDSVEGMTREQAFMQAVMEQGGEAMEKVGDISGTMAVKLEAIKAKFSNIKDTLGTALMPLLELFMNSVLDPLVAKIEEWAPKLTPVIEQFGYLAQAIVDPDQDWVAFLNNEVWEALDNAFGAEAADKIVEFVEETLLNLGEFYDELQDEIIPTLSDVAHTIMEEVIPALVEFATGEGMQAVFTTLGLLIETIETVIGWIDDLIGKIQELNQWTAQNLAAPELRGYTGRAYPYMGEMAPAYFGGYGEALGAQQIVSETNINVTTLPELEEELRAVIDRADRRAVGR